tara:strand:+ start:958 stop:1209 length:252 start_codon:yes stop_codon:yes gene_type:complete
MTPNTEEQTPTPHPKLLRVQCSMLLMLLCLVADLFAISWCLYQFAWWTLAAVVLLAMAGFVVLKIISEILDWLNTNDPPRIQS